MGKRLDEVTIVGGGTSGWLTATFLATALNVPGKEPSVKVSLIESPNIPTVGVGESTLPIMPLMLQALGVNEAEFIRHCNTSFKCGVNFVNWNNDHAGRPISFFNPFEAPHYIQGRHPAYYFQRFGPVDGKASFADSLLPNGTAVAHNKGPRMPDMADYEYAIGYSYHLDAGLFARFLRDVAIARGVHHIQDDVIDVRLNEDGYVSSLNLQNQGELPVKFVVDCSGFKGLIIQQALKEPWISYDKYLLNDRAIPLQVPHIDATHIQSCTTSTALGAGWVWNVPLYTRVGTGYVYSSAFRGEQEAIDEFYQHVGERAKDMQPRIIKMRIGRLRRSWVKNCVAIGLSSGFIEPLEATAIGMIDKAARWLLSYFPDEEFNPALAKQFNTLVGDIQEEVRDFILMHYLTANRDDPYWRAARHEVEIPDTLQHKLELWRHALPSEDTTIGAQMFSFDSYLFVLHGKGLLQELMPPIGNALQRQDWLEYSQALGRFKQDLVQHLPGHHELLTHIRNKASGAAPAEQNALLNV
jgi:tryptophan halogenase